jgi:ADP-heptose:LPS heptosyltransferase
MTERSLCIRRGGLGDTLLFVPVLHALRRCHPGAVLELAGNREYAELCARRGAADVALSSEDLELWAVGGSGAAGERARRRLSRFTRIFADAPELAPLDRPSCRVSVFDPAVRDEAPTPAVVRLLEALRLPVDDELLTAGLRRRSAAPAGAPAVLHPGSGALRKCWPLPCWWELAHRLVGAGLIVTAVAGPAEVERGMVPGRLDGVEDLRAPSLESLATLLEGAAVFVGNDAGPTHLAAALGVPTVAIFGPTDPRVWAPRGDHVRVVGSRTVGPPDATVDAVATAVTALIGGAREVGHA